jgi:hypothetical protein
MMASTPETERSASVSSYRSLFLKISRTSSTGPLVKRLITSKLASLSDSRAFTNLSNY